jgi:predicted permease
MPDWKSEIRQRLAGTSLEPAREAAIVEELAQDLDDCYEDLLTRGATEEEACRLTLAELRGSVTMRRELRRTERRVQPEPIIDNTNRRGKMIAELWQDLRYGARMMRKNPGLSAVIVLTLALGIGANAALFSVVNGVLLNPLPYPQPEQLVTLHQSKPNFDRGAIPYLNFLDMRKENRTFTAMAISRFFNYSLTGLGEPERVRGRQVSAEYFSVLGVKPALGRDFVTDEDKGGASLVALISAPLWKRKFDAAPDVVGKNMSLDDRSYTIIGVLPSSFNLSPSVEIYTLIGQWDAPPLRNRGAALSLHGIGRIKPGVTVAQAQADLDRVMRNLADAYPATNKGNGAKIDPLMESVTGDVRSILWMLLGAVGFVLLIACVNVSNLLLARSTGRGREFAIRAALGAGRRRLLRQSLAESALLSLAGGALGLAVAAFSLKATLNALPTALPRAEEISLDVRVLLFTFAIAMITGILSGLAPALKLSQWRLAETLKEGGRGASAARGRAQGVMVAVEVALALVLLVGAGLMIRSLSAIWNIDPGFRPDNLLTFGLNLPPSFRSASPQATRATLRELSDQLNATPGVRAASFSWGAAPLQSEDDLFFWLDGQTKPSSTSEMGMALVYTVEPTYLAAMGIPLRQGRFFTDQDDERARPVAVIDEAFARKNFGAESPIGRKIHLGDNQEPSQIIGVVGHVKQSGLDTDEKDSLQSQLYLPFRALSDNSLQGAASVSVSARGEGTGASSTALLDSIRRVVRAHGSQNIISRPQTMSEVIAGSLAERRFSMILLNAFAAAALLLANVGLYGVISYLVGQRTQEIGVRVALGASRADVLRLVLSHGMKMALGGVSLGLVAALGLTRLLTNMLYGVSATDPATFVAIALVLTAVALLACFVPAWRATRIDPLVALRYE